MEACYVSRNPGSIVCVIIIASGNAYLISENIDPVPFS
jgi:hypothetical protein